MGLNAGERSRATTSARDSARAVAREWLLPIALGAAALLLDQALRLPVQLPGHNGVLWMGGLLLGRMTSRNGLGASAAGVGGMIAASSSDPLAGFEIAVAGLLMDVLVAFRAVPWVVWAPLVALVANLSVLGLKFATGSIPSAVATRGVGFAVVTYVLYGAIGGAVALVVASVLDRAPRR
jgi:hypothetical protein